MRIGEGFHLSFAHVITPLTFDNAAETNLFYTMRVVKRLPDNSVSILVEIKTITVLCG